MQFDKLVIEKFMSFDSQVLEFGRAGLTLIEGPNGVGKSSLFDAISWVLFGQTVRGLKADEVVHRKFKKDCRVRLHFSAKGQGYTVERFRKHGKYGDRFYYVKEGKTVELGTLPQTQDALLADLGIDFELFRCTVLFAQEETFNFVNATNKAQKDILSKVMRLDYSDFLQRARDAMGTLEDESEVLTSKLTVLRSHVDPRPNEVFQAEIDRWVKDQKEEIGGVELRRIKIHEDMDAIGEYKNLEELEGTYEKLTKQIGRITIGVDEAREIVNNTKSEARIFASKIETKEILASAGKCPECEQPFTAEHAAVEIDSLKVEKNKFDRSTISAKEKFDKLVASLELYRDKQRKLAEVVRSEQNKQYRAMNLALALDGLDGEVERIQARPNPWLPKRAEHVEKQKKIAEKVAEMEKKLESIDAELPYRKFWVNAFGDAGIKSFVFDLICSTLTNKTNRYLSVLTDGLVTVSFDTQKKLKSGETREKFDCIIVTDGERVPYAAYSGGEKRRISLSVDMALSELMSDYYGSKFSMVVFDEQSNYMEKAGKFAFFDLLKDLGEEKQVFVIDHDPELKSRFENVMTVEKRGGVSWIA